MTTFFDSVKMGRASYNRASPPTGYAEDEIYGVPLTQTYVYQVGTASTSLASGVFYASSAIAGTLTGTGALVSSGVATFDVPRCVTITASSNMSTTTFTIQGTDAYGAPLTASVLGPTGNTFGNSGSVVTTLSAFKTVTTASANGAATGPLAIGNSDTFGLPYRLTNVGEGLGAYINGGSASLLRLTPLVWLLRALLRRPLLTFAERLHWLRLFWPTTPGTSPSSLSPRTTGLWPVTTPRKIPMA
jgi:hypothetical protein